MERVNGRRPNIPPSHPAPGRGRHRGDGDARLRGLVSTLQHRARELLEAVRRDDVDLAGLHAQEERLVRTVGLDSCDVARALVLARSAEAVPTPFEGLMLGLLASVGEALHHAEGRRGPYEVPDYLPYVGAFARDEASFRMERPGMNAGVRARGRLTIWRHRPERGMS